MTTLTREQIAGLKPATAWAIANIGTGNIYPYCIHSTRRGAVKAFCDNGPNYAPDDWKKLRKMGWRAIKARVLPLAGEVANG